LIPLGRSNVFLGKVILLQSLKKFTSGGVLLQVIIAQSFKLIIKRHLQRAIPSRFELFFQREFLKIGAKINLKARDLRRFFSRLNGRMS
jgi:hypothetical protein